MSIQVYKYLISSVFTHLVKVLLTNKPLSLLSRSYKEHNYIEVFTPLVQPNAHNKFHVELFHVVSEFS